MPIALIAHYLGPSLGIGKYLDRLLPPLIEELMAREIDVKILGSPNAITNTRAFQCRKDIIQPLPPLDYTPSKRFAWFASRFTRYCQSREIEAVAWLSNPIVLPWHPPSLATIHDVNEWAKPTKYGSRLKTALRAAIYLDSSLLFAKKIILVSQATEHTLYQYRSSSKLKSKLKVIPNGSDSSLIKLAPVEIPVPNAPFLLSVGRIDPIAKRLPEAVALVCALREFSSQPWELHLVGGMNRSTEAKGKAFLKEIAPRSWVHYHGYVDDPSLAQWYRQATAVVFLSDQEGFGFPVAEAASFGRWVIVSDKNQAAAEAGTMVMIPVDPDHPEQAADLVLNRLSQEIPKSLSSSTWQEAALAYAEEICTLVPTPN
ncbi:glycosyltransferase [Crocosphaera sp. UHCC 0190]|uniref:glycosyltransferase n=1 Tax=Crocosphaera sp. UHCC 0190 TaxID=3110246 RepID=UPI002B2134AB|nr:glycosyltransferase [Crocosphaera sp. UHCC 0190]MEA5510546.1 glycosyltransferase [Crocosphaera sp. UHCC 0190]